MENVATFSFSDGSSIEIDRNCTISGMLKCGNFSDKMCPDISYRGKSISVNGDTGRATRNPLAISFLGISRVAKTATLISIKCLGHSYLQVTLHVSETLANSPWTNVRKGQKRVNT